MKYSVFVFSSTFALFTTLFGSPGSAGEMLLSNTSGWKIVLNLNDDSSFNRCITQSDQKGQMLRLAHNGQIWSLSVPAGHHRNGADGTIGFNGEQPEWSRFSADRHRAWAEIHPDTADFMSRARTIEVAVGNKTYSWNLRGVSDAMLRVGECLERFSK